MTPDASFSPATDRRIPVPQSFAVADLAPERVWDLILNSGLPEISWRRAIVDKPQTAPQPAKVEPPPVEQLYVKGKLTGSPAFKELKSLIIAILLNNNAKAKPQ